MNWLEALISRAERLWPWTRVRPWERAVRSTFIPWGEVRVAVLGPGIARHIWFFDELVVRDIREDSYNLASQSITTKDDASVSLGANFMYEIEDARLAVMGVQDFASSLQDLAMMHIAERVREWTWDELRDGQKELERSLKETLSTRARRWGVRITKCGLTDMVKARQHRLFGELSTG